MNIFEAKAPKKGEIFKEIYKKNGVLIETICSSEKLEKKIYKQPWDEWVVLLKGEAVLEMEGEIKELKEGDEILIKADTKHRVLKAKQDTLWLCVHAGIEDE